MAEAPAKPDANSVLRVHGPKAVLEAFDRGSPGQCVRPTLRATPYAWQEPASIPSRRWLLGRYLSPGLVSMTIAPGGIGKSSLAVCEAISLASGRDLLHYGTLEPSRVWYWNLEDGMRDLACRIQAACKHHGVREDEIADRLLVDSGLERPLCLGTAMPGGHQLDESLFLQLTHAIRVQQIDVVIIDPLVSSHLMDENNNMQMDALLKRLARLANTTGCAVSLIHHTRKSGPDGETSTESGRGAKALTDAARVVRVLNLPSDDEVSRFELEHRRSAFRARLDKQNFAAAVDQSDWFKLLSVELGNGEEVGVVERYSPHSTSASLAPEQILEIQAKCGSHGVGASSQATDAAYKIVAEVLGLNIHDAKEKSRAKHVLKQLLRDKYLKETRGPKKGKSEDRPIIIPGKAPDQ